MPPTRPFNLRPPHAGGDAPSRPPQHPGLLTDTPTSILRRCYHGLPRLLAGPPCSPLTVPRAATTALSANPLAPPILSGAPSTLPPTTSGVVPVAQSASAAALQATSLAGVASFAPAGTSVAPLPLSGVSPVATASTSVQPPTLPPILSGIPPVATAATVALPPTLPLIFSAFPQWPWLLPWYPSPPPADSHRQWCPGLPRTDRPGRCTASHLPCPGLPTDRGAYPTPIQPPQVYQPLTSQEQTVAQLQAALTVAAGPPGTSQHPQMFSPLCNTVPAIRGKLSAAAAAGEFVDFSELLHVIDSAKGGEEPPVQFELAEGHHLTLTKRPIKKGIKSFAIYANTFCTHHPQRATDMIGYLFMIASALHEFSLAAVLAYDDAFRRKV